MTIHVRNWERFQHADVTKRKMRVPAWIRLYTELQSKEEFRALTMHQRGVLVSVWIEYARSGRQLSDNTATLTRQLGQRVMTRDIEALNHAGFLEIRQDAVTPLSSLEERREDKSNVYVEGSEAPDTPTPAKTARFGSFHDAHPPIPKTLADLGLGTAVKLGPRQWAAVLAAPRRAAATLWEIRYSTKIENPSAVFWTRFQTGAWPDEYVERGEDHEDEPAQKPGGLDLDALDAWDEKQAETEEPTNLASHKTRRAEINGTPLDRPDGVLADLLRARAQPP